MYPWQQIININKLFLYLFFGVSLFGAIPTLDTLDDFPCSQAKDFYIWNFLKDEIQPEKADEIFEQTYHVTPKLFKAYAPKSASELIRNAGTCLTLSTKELFQKRAPACKALALTPNKAVKMTPRQRRNLAKELRDEAPSVAKWLFLMDGKHTVGTRFFNEPELFLYLFNRVGSAYRRSHFNVKLSDRFLKKLLKEEEFEKFVEITAIDKNLKKVNTSLLEFDSALTNSTLARFYFALIKIMYHHEKDALKDLEFVAQNDFFQLERDKALFWKYLITKKNAILDTLYRSTDLNIYTIFAAQQLHQEPIGVYQPKMTNINPLAVQEKDPFIWSKLLIENQDANASFACQILENFESLNNISIYSFFLERCANYALHPFIMPYSEETNELSVEKRALFYALGRQESRLIAGGLSYVYAQGLMQLMPFLSKAIAKQKHQKITPDSMFEPKKNIEYAKHHLKYLHRKLNHPLFIAYAYNGGIGFLKRTLKRGYFKNHSKYDPFLSMELLSYPETRNYGKKVLANYVIYSSLMGRPILIQSLFESLK